MSASWLTLVLICQTAGASPNTRCQAPVVMLQRVPSIDQIAPPLSARAAASSDQPRRSVDAVIEQLPAEARVARQPPPRPTHPPTVPIDVERALVGLFGAADARSEVGDATAALDPDTQDYVAARSSSTSGAGPARPKAPIIIRAAPKP